MEIRHYKFHRVTLDPNKCFGKPCIHGMRMPVASTLREWRELESEVIYEARGYPAWAMQERIVSSSDAAA